MARQYVTFTVEEGVATVTLSNPPANLLSTPLMTELEQVLDELAADPAAKVIVFTGAGANFVAGADVREIAGITTKAKGEEMTSGGHRDRKSVV